MGMTGDRGRGVETITILTGSLTGSGGSEAFSAKMDGLKWGVAGAASTPLLNIFANAPGALVNAQLAIDVSPDGTNWTVAKAATTITGATLIDMSIAILGVYIRFTVSNTNVSAQVVTVNINIPNTRVND